MNAHVQFVGQVTGVVIGTWYLYIVDSRGFTTGNLPAWEMLPSLPLPELEGWHWGTAIVKTTCFSLWQQYGMTDEVNFLCVHHSIPGHLSDIILRTPYVERRNSHQTSSLASNQVHCKWLYSSSYKAYCLINDADWSEWCYVPSQTSYKWFHFSSHTTKCTSALKLKHSITKTIWNHLLGFLVYGTPYHLSMFVPAIRKILKKYFKATISLMTILALTICVSMF